MSYYPNYPGTNYPNPYSNTTPDGHYPLNNGILPSSNHGYPVSSSNYVVNQRPTGWLTDSNHGQYYNQQQNYPSAPHLYPPLPQPISYPPTVTQSAYNYYPSQPNISVQDYPSCVGSSIQFPGSSVYPNYPSIPSNNQQFDIQQNVIPTVYPVSPFDPRSDAEILHRAMKGFGTDEQTLIAILCRRTRHQRVLISQSYKSNYGRDLESKLKSELSGCLERTLVALSLPVDLFMAREVHDAIRGLGTDDQTLIEILCSSTNQEIRDMNNAYLRLYKRSMERDIKDDTSGVFKNLLVSLAQGQRDEFQSVDYQNAKTDALRLFHAGEGRIGTDESTFNSMLVTRSWPYLRQIMAEYQSISGHSLETAVAKEFSFNAEKGLLAILRCARNRPAYFASRLHNAIIGLGTKDRSLTRIIVTRSDIDLGNIKLEYGKEFGRSLQSDVAGDTSGDYKKALLTLLN